MFKSNRKIKNALFNVDKMLKGHFFDTIPLGGYVQNEKS